MLRKNEKKALCAMSEEDLASVNGAIDKSWASGVFYTLGSMSNDRTVKAFFSGAIRGVNKS
ncbi:hypothetical protein [Anaeromyxobacter sp. Fw109-5]|uniref:hypothetical protein n=1 Tax=Anaeromyxobacter sp. (strain Fw109-5) TaxID=404589 RepID=UPI0002E43503|nr:hypothetical protein [Anaeromyxobacter sp. Fw109-5]